MLNRIKTTSELRPEDIGRWVTYWPTGEKGRIKSWNNSFVFVVYRCDDNWSDYANYTAASTHPAAIEFCEAPNLKEGI